MEICFVGTAASEGFPAPFCACQECQSAKREGGKNLRRRSSAVVDGQVLIDFGPDTYTAYLSGIVDLLSITDIVLTHSHTDHFYERELVNLFEPMSLHNPNLPIKIYGNETVIAQIKNYMVSQRRCFDQFSEVMTLIIVQPFESFKVAHLTFTALLANHAGPNENAYIYEIFSGDKSMLYGTDTGLLPAETVAYLQQHPQNLYVFDATTGSYLSPYDSHMSFREIAQTLEAIGMPSHSDIPIFGTHFVHGFCGLHDELIEQGKQYGIIPAYDGLILKI
ncbi:phosphoribosyl 1,2-cyclic phosphate phosphodiesterase [Streptococcus rupicaprae]|uniref:Phosphoribosyl 1,2-cyclic phosphate phosphodiesterase n=1 Tax=Streptococcus rupicaprae TaxID=759619 RepID=A0ABV2FGH8_9STRE